MCIYFCFETNGKFVCVCVCVCERERERLDGDTKFLPSNLEILDSPL